MSKAINPAATNELAFFITAPGEPDILLIIMAGFLILVAVLVGQYLLHLYGIPHRRTHTIQREVVVVLALLGLLTLNPYLWLAALLLALAPLPDLSTPINRMSEALTHLADKKQGQAELADRRQQRPKIEPPSLLPQVLLPTRHSAVGLDQVQQHQTE